MANASLALAALADPTRRSLFERVRRRPHAVGELARALRVSQPAVSQHLAVLRRARLVAARAEGARRLYSATPQGLEALRAWIETMWGDVLAAYAASDQSSQLQPGSRGARGRSPKSAFPSPEVGRDRVGGR